MQSKTKNPFPSNYRPEIDVSEELNHYFTLSPACWHAQMGSGARQTAGCVLLEVLLPLQCQASPRVGHLDALHHVFACLRGHPNMGWIACDPVDPKEGAGIRKWAL